MEKSTKALLALALLLMASMASIEGGRDVPRKEEADSGSPLQTSTFGVLFPWLWWGNGGGGAPWGDLISWLAEHPWFAGHPWFGGYGGNGGGAPTPRKASYVAKQGDTP